MKLKIKIIGPRVHGVGYRPMLWQIAMDLSLKGFDAINVVKSKPQAVIVLIESDEERVKMFSEVIRTEKPALALVESISEEPYEGEVMALMDYATLNTSRQLNKGVSLLLSIDGKVDSMLLKHDQTIEELKGIKEEIQPGLSVQIQQLMADMKAVKDRLGMP